MSIDTSKCRIYIKGGRRSRSRVRMTMDVVRHYDDASLAYKVYLALPKDVRAVFRAAGDETPVYPHDFVRGM